MSEKPSGTRKRRVSLVAPSVVDRRSTANRERRVTSYNANTLQLKSKSTRAPRKTIAAPELPRITEKRQSVLATPIPKDLLDQAAVYEASANDTRLSFGIFKSELLEEIDRKLFADRPYKKVYQATAGRIQRNNDAVAIPRESVAAANIKLRRAPVIKGRKAKTKKSEKKDSDGATSLPAIKMNNFIVSVEEVDDKREGNDQSNTSTNNPQETRNEAGGTNTLPEEEEEEEDELEPLFDPNEIDVPERDISDILQGIDFEKENESIQQELNHTREASALSQAQNTAYLEENLDLLVEIAEENNITSKLIDMTMEHNKNRAEYLMAEAKKGELRTEMLLKAVAGEIYDDAWKNLDTLVPRTMPEIKLPHYAFHHEIQNLISLRKREKQLEREFLETQRNLRNAQIDLDIVEEELERLTDNLNEIEEYFENSLDEAMKLVGHITKRDPLPKSIVTQIQTLTTTSLVQYIDAVTADFQSVAQPSQTLQRAQTNSLDVITSLKIKGPKLRILANQGPVVAILETSNTESAAIPKSTSTSNKVSVASKRISAYNSSKEISVADFEEMRPGSGGGGGGRPPSLGRIVGQIRLKNSVSAGKRRSSLKIAGDLVVQDNIDARERGDSDIRVMSAGSEV
ncbi:hypothetical protein BCR33DRAFT_847652 [Rhizoclosmatium globosum]|uniref:Uncharacterized protein n=1 Tax=Rhizoclosmatium globosum TaxID=329046 RepID=A0A1Y2CPJ1_9FUNG|nr:hypothetical protein BCR33DRAFT_847652 [Rhizoclosmatium globosum]|eukprot:ORY48959.1 hypothetical protein BCR33DRAFT_847652 [Rhizoclosmatium globosum]